jgi:hypothetical protein
LTRFTSPPPTYAELMTPGLYGLFFCSGEGKFYPDGTEEFSGNAVDRDGRIWMFWTEWDAERSAIGFAYWVEIVPDSRWVGSSEYEQARAQVGL